MSFQTVNDIFYHVVERANDRVMTFKQTVKWIPISTRELYRDVVGVARTLTSWGIGKGDRVAILAENRPEWAVTDFATLLIGAAVVPIYATLTSDQVAYILKDSGARVLFLSTAEQLQKFLAIRHQTAVEKVVIMDYVGITEAIPMHRLMHEGPAARDAEFDARAQAVREDDLATLIYTSGTTGTPKGVMLTHGNLTSNLMYSLKNYEFKTGEVHISFLPLSHVTARHADYAMFYHGVTIAYCPRIDELPKIVPEVRPTIYIGVPRVYEKIYSRVHAKTSGGIKGLLYQWALQVGRENMAEVVAGKRPSSMSWRVADRLVYSKIRGAMGGRVKLFISGGAPLGRELAEWYACLGMVIHEGYGLTETSPVIAINAPGRNKLGTVGRPLENVEVRIADDGEILVRGPSIFKGYWNMPEETRNAFSDGFFKTGDIGMLDADGYLSITDRKKDLIKTSGGKFIAPQPIENMLKTNPLIAEAVVVGDRRKFPAVVISPHFATLEDWAQSNGVRFNSRQELLAERKVQELFESAVAEVNKDMAQFEKIKRVVVVPDEFSIADGTLTPTMKLKRRVVQDRYKDQIEAIYRDAEMVEPAARIS